MTAAGTIAYIGLGSNLQEPLFQCRLALEKLRGMTGVKLLRASSFYRTEPIGVRNQDSFVNAVVEIRTILSPRRLWENLRATEQVMGRQETQRWGPRLIDLDIIFYGQELLREDDLVIPHPECHRRRFVLIPMCELAGYLVHPAFGISVQGLLIRLNEDDRAAVELISQ